MSRYVRKLMPFLSCDIPAIEKWLTDMAGKGLLFADSGYFTVKFEKAEPVNRRFHLEYADGLGSNLKDEKREVYEECGWTVVNDFKSSLVVVYTDDEFAPEPYDDKVKMVEPYDKIYKNQRALAFMFLAMSMLMKIAYPVTAMMNGEGDILEFFLSVGTWRYIIRCIVFVLLICECVFRFVRAKRLKEYIECVKTDKDYNGKQVKKNAFGTAMIVLAAPLVIAFCIQLFTMDGVHSYVPKEYSAEECAEVYPFPDLAQINADEYAVILAEKEKGEVFFNYIHEEKDYLAPRMIELEQQSGGSGGHVFEYHVMFYEMRREEYAEKKFNDEIAEFINFDAEQYKRTMDKMLEDLEEWGGEYDTEYDGTAPEHYIKDLSTSDADVYYIIERYTNFEKQYLVIKSGVYYELINYLGDSDLSEYVDLYISYLEK